MLETYLADIYKREDDVANFGLLFRKYVSNEGNFLTDWNKIFDDEDIELLQYDIVKLEVPEAAVYLENIKNIGKIFQARREATTKKILADALKYERQLLDEEDLDKARKFGEIMKEYPDIVKYYQIEKVNPKAKIVLQNQPSLIQLETNESAPEKITSEAAPYVPEEKKSPEPPIQAKEIPKEPETGKIPVIEKAN
jgi:hypothetical protein